MDQWLETIFLADLLLLFLHRKQLLSVLLSWIRYFYVLLSKVYIIALLLTSAIANHEHKLLSSHAISLGCSFTRSFVRRANVLSEKASLRQFNIKQILYEDRFTIRSHTSFTVSLRPPIYFFIWIAWQSYGWRDEYNISSDLSKFERVLIFLWNWGKTMALKCKMWGKTIALKCKMCKIISVFVSDEWPKGGRWAADAAGAG